MEKKELCRTLPYGSCPICGHVEFIILETNTMAYLTDKDGNLDPGDQVYYDCKGKCINCNAEFERMEIYESKVLPMSKIRSLFDFDLEFSHKYYSEKFNPDSLKLKNPMEASKDEQ